MIRGELTIQLPEAKGHLTLSGTFNAFDLDGDERAVVFAVLDVMQKFQAEHPAPQPLVVADVEVADPETKGETTK